MVASTTSFAESAKLLLTTHAGHSSSTSQARSCSSAEENGSGCFQVIREALCAKGLLEESAKIIVDGWRKSTQKQYASFIKRWVLFCGRKSVSQTKPDINIVLQFLTELYQLGLSYSALGTARAAINAFTTTCDGVDFSSNNLLKMFMKGVFHNRPNLPKHPVVWDVNIVLDYLANENDDSLLFLSEKLCLLFLLLSAQRCQTLHLIHINDIVLHANHITIQTSQLLKQSRPSFHLKPIVLFKYPKNDKLCIVETFKLYLQRTETLRNTLENKLLISTQSPHKGVTRATVSRWVKSMLTKAGIDARFTAHSTRAVATSTAKMKGVPLDKIAKAAGWSNVDTFRRFYDKPLPDASFQNAILS